MNVLIRLHQTKILSKATYQSTRRGEQNKQQKKQRDHSSQQASTPSKTKPADKTEQPTETTKPPLRPTHYYPRTEAQKLSQTAISRIPRPLVK
jgi:hypothetical protein